MIQPKNGYASNHGEPPMMPTVPTQTLPARCYEYFMGQRADAIFKTVALWLALVGFALHLLAWGLVRGGMIVPPAGLEPLLASPLLALYTPFSILLVYEVYQLIQAIPKSFSAAMTKQFEVIALIVVRDALAYLAATDPFEQFVDVSWFLLLLAKCATFLVLLLVALGFTRHERRRTSTPELSASLVSYVRVKRVISLILVACFAVMAITAFVGWIAGVATGDFVELDAGIFFADFFTLLIIADIAILLISYRYTSEFGSLARNTGFVLATILIRLAIDAPGYGAPLLFLLSGVVGFGVLWITNRFEEPSPPATV
ncbi:MAG: hypothetical protein VX684_06345 [Planctomycetota bacterium]|nr:hypothetical protein [Planctomycetota bacterium]